MSRSHQMTMLAFCLCIAMNTGEASDDISPDALLGTWAAACDAWGTPAECRLEWRRGLHPEHLRVDYRITGEADARRIFAGIGTYHTGTEAFTGYWAGSNGAIHPLHGSWEGGVLTTHWGTPATEQGRSEYRLLDERTLQVTDWVLVPSGWRQFMQVRYQLTQN